MVPFIAGFGGGTVAALEAALALGAALADATGAALALEAALAEAAVSGCLTAGLSPPQASTVRSTVAPPANVILVHGFIESTSSERMAPFT
jgi:hypothetical protein